MKTLQFRVWSEENKKMQEVCDINFADMTVWSYSGKVDTSPEEMKESEYKELMQFTGLRDKSNTDIYEGDIITFKCGNDGCDHLHESEVIFIDDLACFGIKNEKGEESPLQLPITAEYSNEPMGVGLMDIQEVIGNIYEKNTTDKR